MTAMRTFMHMFHNDYWLFDEATDPVILMLPDVFFMHCAVGIVGLVIAGAVGCLAVYRAGTKKNAAKAEVE